MSDLKQRGGATQTITKSTPKVPVNFLTALVLLLLGLFKSGANVPPETASGLVTSAIALIGGGVAIYNVFKVGGYGTDILGWIQNPNTWTHITAVLGYLVPSLSPEASGAVQNLVNALIGGNWAQVVPAVFALASILFFYFKKK